jgi:hypothetical protein
MCEWILGLRTDSISSRNWVYVSRNQGTSTRDCRKQQKNNLNTLMRIMIDFYVIYLRKTKYHGVTAVMRVLTVMFIR